MYNITYVLYNKKYIRYIVYFEHYNIQSKGGTTVPLFSFLTFVVITSFTPGPNNFMAMLFANKQSFTKTIPFSLGVGAGFFMLIGLCSLFNIALTNIMPIIKLPLTLFGVGYMLYLAFRIVTSKASDLDKEGDNNRHLFLVGILLQFINPKGILFGITVVATYILPYYSSYFSYFLFAVFLGIIGILSTCSWALFGSAFQKILHQYRQPFNIIMALLLVYSAISILVQS